MIILDTNVVSALMKPGAEPRVPQWLNSTSGQHVRTSVVTLMELHYGINRMPVGRKRLELEFAFGRLKSIYLGEALPFDERAAMITAEILAQAHSVGRNLDYPDMQIAGIALANEATLATRNTRDFAGLGLKLVNPWD